MTVTGRTAGGAVSSHQFTLGDETTMVDNVCGPALGFLLRGVSLYQQQGLAGLMTSADLMPRFSSGARVSTSAASGEALVGAVS